jgi:hypothetical protein
MVRSEGAPWCIVVVDKEKIQVCSNFHELDRVCVMCDKLTFQLISLYLFCCFVAADQLEYNGSINNMFNKHLLFSKLGYI